MFGLDAVLGQLVSNATGGEEGEKTRSKTHLPTDKILTLGSLIVPLVLLMFTRVFAGNTFRAASLNCAPFQTATYARPEGDEVLPSREIMMSSHTNRFYMNNYCWERLQHHKLNSSMTLSQILKSAHQDGEETEVVNLSINKYFPYAMFALIVLAAMPMLIWTRVAADSIQPQVEFMVGGLKEAMGMTIETITKFHKDGKMYIEDDSRLGLSGTKHREIVSAETIFKLFEKEYELKQELLGAKFKTLTGFVRSKVRQNGLIQQFIMYRMANFIGLMVSTGLLWKYSLENKRSLFNCVVPFSSTDMPQQSQISEMISCTIDGVIVRRYVSVIWCLCNMFLLVAGIMGTVNEIMSAKNASSLLKITEPICKHGLEVDGNEMNTENSFIGVNDLHILLMLAKHNFGSNKIMSMCLQAHTMMRYLGADKNYGADKNGPYLRQLAAQVTWFVNEKFDDEVNLVTTETIKSRG